ncbi:hypothetical protein ACMD2_10743, partial [Ananas comosus]
VSGQVFPLSPAEAQVVRGVRRRLEVENSEGCAFKRKRDAQMHPSPFERCGVITCWMALSQRLGIIAMLRPPNRGCKKAHILSVLDTILWNSGLLLSSSTSDFDGAYSKNLKSIW